MFTYIITFTRKKANTSWHQTLLSASNDKGQESFHLSVVNLGENFVDIDRTLDDFVVVGKFPPSWQLHEGIAQDSAILRGHMTDFEALFSADDP